MENIILYSIDYYKKSVFKGSYRGMNFRIQKSNEEDSPRLVATAWKGPFILEKSKEIPQKKEFEFSQEGLTQADSWLEEMQKILCPEDRMT